MPGRALPAPLAGDHRAGPRAAGRGVEARRNVAQGVYYPQLCGYGGDDPAAADLDW
jgi:hypothetical protein